MPEVAQYPSNPPEGFIYSDPAYSYSYEAQQ
jgi:hypothetical protein